MIAVYGLRRVLNNLNAQITKRRTATLRGLIKAAFLIEGESKKRTPVDTGNLRASHFVSWENHSPRTPRFSDRDENAADLASSFQGTAQAAARIVNKPTVREPSVVLGVGAYYGIYVHEDMQADHTKTGKDGQPIVIGEAKFLENAFNVKRNEAIQIIKREAGVMM
jgi:hypothetical protein